MTDPAQIWAKILTMETVAFDPLAVPKVRENIVAAMSVVGSSIFTDGSFKEALPRGPWSSGMVTRALLGLALEIGCDTAELAGITWGVSVVHLPDGC